MKGGRDEIWAACLYAAGCAAVARGNDRSVHDIEVRADGAVRVEYDHLDPAFPAPSPEASADSLEWRAWMVLALVEVEIALAGALAEYRYTKRLHHSVRRFRDYHSGLADMSDEWLRSAVFLGEADDLALAVYWVIMVQRQVDITDERTAVRAFRDNREAAYKKLVNHWGLVEREARQLYYDLLASCGGRFPPLHKW